MCLAKSAGWKLRQFAVVGAYQLGGNYWGFVVVTNLTLWSSHETLYPTKPSMSQALVPQQQLLLLMCQIVIVLVEKSNRLLELSVLDQIEDLSSCQSNHGCAVI